MLAVQAFLIFCCFQLSTAATVDELVALIQKANLNTQTFQFPTDASQHRPVDYGIKDLYADIDFIIIGGSPSGCVLTRRLADERRYKILLLEAGNFSDQGLLQFPRLFSQQTFTNYNWAYTTTPQYSACLKNANRTCRYDMGKGVGGNSLIGQVVYSRGHPENFNCWARRLNDPSWNYQNLLPYFKKIENFHDTAPKATVDPVSHGYLGMVHVQHRTPPDYLFSDAFWDASKELGYPQNDPNGPTPVGAFTLQLYTKNGTREDMGTVFVPPNLGNPYLQVLPQSYVLKVEINNQTKVVDGVIFSFGGSIYRVKAKREVILSAGAIGSARIMLSSGVGPRRHLEALGVGVVQDLEVGSSFKDYARAQLIFSTNVTRPVDDWKVWVQQYLNGQGDLTGVSRVQAGGYYPLGYAAVSRGVPNIRISTDIALSGYASQKYLDYSSKIDQAWWGLNETARNAISFTSYLMNPKSFGTIRLKSDDPFDYPLIDPRMYTDLNDEDISNMYEGIKLIFRLKDTISYQRYKTTYSGKPLPPCQNLEFLSKDYWYCYLRVLTTPEGFPVSTCPMGTTKTKGAVVDSKLRVLGISGLRIADEGVFPTPLAGHPSIQAAVVGEKLADMLKAQYPPFL